MSNKYSLFVPICHFPIRNFRAFNPGTESRYTHIPTVKSISPIESAVLSAIERYSRFADMNCAALPDLTPAEREVSKYKLGV